MTTLTLAVGLCMCFAVIHAAPAAEVVETPAEVNSVPEEAVEVENKVDGPLPVVDAEEAGVEEDLPPVEDIGEGAEDNQADQGRMVVCPPGWFRRGSHCFLLVTSRMSWIHAEKYCVAQQGSLASVQSPDEYNFLQSLARLSGQSAAWIGGFYFQGAWMWIDRAGFYYTNWQSQNSVSHYQCLQLNYAGGWSNSNCGNSYAFFCARGGPSCL